MNTKEALLACADYLEENGWVQFDSIGLDGKSMCSVAVMDEVANHEPYWGPAYDGMRNAMVAHLGIPRSTIAHWNDDRDRTKEEVVAAFRGAAEAL